MTEHISEIVWVSVIEKLPNLYETVMFFWRQGSKAKMSIGQLAPLAVIDKGSKYRSGFQSQMMWESMYQIETEVSHWAHLPEIPG